MTMDTTSWVLAVAIGIFLIATLGLWSSVCNRRRLADIKRTVEHTDRNAKMAKEALTRREAKQDALQAAAAASPMEVTIVNQVSDPVPTKDVSEEK